MQAIRASFALAALLALSSGCVSGSGDPVEPIPGSGGEVIDQVYPTENIGTTVGSVVANVSFNGYTNPDNGVGPEHQVTITFGDFYNPTGDGVYGPDSPFEEGSPKPKALVINIGAVWCAPCKQEAAQILPDEYAAMHPKGMELLLVLADSIAVGEAATFTDLDSWVTGFPVSYPSVIDPKKHMANLADPSQFPANIVLDTRTMKMVEFVPGIPPETFWSTVEAVLASE